MSRNKELTNRVLDTDGETDKQEEIDYRLQLMRDEIIEPSRGNTSTVGVPDDLFPIPLIDFKSRDYTTTNFNMIANKMRTQGVVVIRASIDDEIVETENNPSIVRLLSSESWNIDQEKPYATIKSVGIGQLRLMEKQMHLWICIPFWSYAV